jgi:hypothetical protein
MGSVGEGRTEPPSRRLTVEQAADHLGVSTEAIRGRIRRDTIRHERVGGRVYVLLSADQESEQTPDHTAELIRTLQEQLAAERQAHAEARRIIAGLVERIPPAIEARQESPAPPEPDTMGTDEDEGEPSSIRKVAENVSGGVLTQALIAGLPVGGSAALALASSIYSISNSQYVLAGVILAVVTALLIVVFYFIPNERVLDVAANAGAAGGVLFGILAALWYFFFRT